jgi:hypothetical protein
LRCGEKQMSTRVKSRLTSTAKSLARRVGLEVVRIPRGLASTTRSLDLEPAGSSGPPLVISTVLYGDNPRYVYGAERNAEMYGEMFPGWSLVIFCDDSVPLRVRESLASFSNVRMCDPPYPAPDYRRLFWRFTPILWSGTAAVIIRDLDSRPTTRERAAVDEWLASGRALHIMRDHPEHTEPIMGGMFGVLPNALPDFHETLLAYGPDDSYGCDQRFLGKLLYLRLIDNALVHQDAPSFQDPPATCVRPFPVALPSGQFIGQGWECDGQVREGHAQRSGLPSPANTDGAA